ncbi:MAG: hypothetical protein A2061_08990 [Gallionellales bacterium GWA2_59_43]|nr:MAG: hypothetical protein A2061_08990 [Gallionellales bacterium GWA2_59_43]
MKWVRVAGWVSVGLVLAAGGAYAQEPARKVGATAKQAAKPDAAALQQAQREAAARAEQEVRERAAAEAKRLAELEAREKPLRDADELLKAGKPAEAYTLLEPFEFERSGEVRFDYLLGISALDSGKPDKATLALERVLAVDPNFAGARLDMARAYYQLGDLPRAKTEFEHVMGQNPPDAAKTTIQKYLDAIAAYEQDKKTRISAYAEGVVGHDSNANSATNETQVKFGLLTYTLVQDSRKSPDSYAGFAAGGEVSHSLNANWGAYAGADMRKRSNMALTQFDSAGVDGRAGVMYGTEQNIFKLSLTGGQSYSANSMRRDALGLSTEWQHTFSPANQTNAFAQYGQYRATGSPSTSLTTDARTSGDIDQWIVGLGWLHALDDGKQVLFASVFSGKEMVATPLNVAQPPDGEKRFDGVRIGGQAVITDQADAFASIGWMHSIYEKVNILTINNDRRSERQYDLTIGGNWRLDKFWSIKPQMALSRKTSNAAIFGFDRADVSLTIRRDFR